jgi:nitroreductase
MEKKKDYYVKPRTADYPVNELIHDRWSPVCFADDPIELEKIHTLFEAARWAPSCFNEQPWSFVFGVKGKGDSHEKILSCLTTGNQEWAHAVPLLGISVARLNFEKNDKSNRHAYHDVGLAMGILCVQAVDLELSVHQMAGFDVEKAREVLKIPEGHDPVAAIAIGYMTNPDNCDNEKLQAREKTIGQRKPQKEFLFDGEWGKSLRPRLQPSPPL